MTERPCPICAVWPLKAGLERVAVEYEHNGEPVRTAHHPACVMAREFRPGVERGC